MNTITRTKIIATYGPATTKPGVLKQMIQEGVDVVRFNFSHGDWTDHKEGFDLVKEINEELGTHVAILADLQGPKIRVGKVENDSVELEEGSTVTITCEDVITTSEVISVSYPDIARDVKKGEIVLLDDGKLQVRVSSTDRKKELKAEVIHGGTLKSRKGVNLPNTKISLPSVTEEDLKNFSFAVENGASWIALSFVRDPNDVLELKRRIGSEDEMLYLKVIAKIEKPQACENIDAIIEVADGIMIARGDLGVEMPQETVPLIQKEIINKCMKAAKPVIVATQMMESMIDNPRPTRAEITDVANAVLDGADAVMLSAETSVGDFPVKVIHTMHSILLNIEQNADIYNKQHTADPDSETYVSDAVCYTSCSLAEHLGAKAIIGMTRSGYTAFMASSYRPRADIFIFTDNKKLLNTLSICWGVRGFFYNRFVSTDVTIRDVIRILKKRKLVNKGDLVVNSASMPMREQARTNMVKVTKIK